MAMFISCSEESLPLEPNPIEDSIINVEPISSVLDDVAVEILDKSLIPDATLAERMVYTDYYLTSIMEAVIELNPEFEDIDEFKSSKDEKPAVYLEGLLNYAAQKVNYDATSMKNAKKLFEAFTDLEGETWYPVLKRIRKGNRGAKNAIYLLKSFDENLQEEYIKAYRLKENGNLKLIHKKYSEEVHNASKATSSVYYVTLSSCLPGDDPVQKAAYDDCSGGGGGGTSGSNFESLKIEKLKILDKKESWLSKADVRIFGYAMSNNPAFFDPLGYYWGKDVTHHEAKIYTRPYYLLDKFSSKDVKNGVFKTVNHHIMYYNKNLSESPTFVSHIIYEYDGFPAPIKQVLFGRPDGPNAVISYRSYNQYYAAKRVRAHPNFVPTNFYMPRGFGNTVRNNVIEYKYNPAN